MNTVLEVPREPIRARLAAVGARVVRLWTQGRPAERLGYAAGLALMVGGVFHALVFLVDGGAWQGPVSWRKPTTFGLSFGLTLVTLTWLTTYLRLRGRARWALIGVLAVAGVVEVGLVSMQAWRGVPSHFNQATSFDAAVFAAMGVSVGFIGAIILVVTVLAWTASDASPSMTWAIRIGLLALVVAQGLGGLMIADGVAELAANEQARAYVAGGLLKPAHAVTMHGVQVLPVLGFLLAATPVAERLRLRLVLLAAAAYLLIAAVAVTQSLTSAPLVSGTASGLALVAGVLTLLVAVGGVLTLLLRTPLIPSN